MYCIGVDTDGDDYNIGDNDAAHNDISDDDGDDDDICDNHAVHGDIIGDNDAVYDDIIGDMMVMMIIALAEEMIRKWRQLLKITLFATANHHQL